MMKYWHIFVVAFRHRNVFLFDVVSSLFSYTIRIFLIITLFRYLKSTAPGAFGTYSLLELSWALVFAQISTLGIPNIAYKVSEDIASWKIGVYLLNPVSYPVFKAFETLSWSISNIVFMSIMAIGIGAAFIGLPAISLSAVLAGIILLLGAFCILVLIQIQIGIFAFIFENVQPLRWIVYRLNMLFGGNILPIAFLPGWLQAFTFATPFAYTGYTAGLIFAAFRWETFSQYLGMQIFWIAFFTSTIALTYTLFSRRIVINGG